MNDSHTKAFNLYNDLAVNLFYRAAYTKFLDELDGNLIEFRAGDIEKNQLIHLKCIELEGKIVLARFQAYGCPYFIASSEWLCEQLEGSVSNKINKIKLQDLMDLLAIPIEKKSIILLLEDAMNGIRLQLNNCN